MVDRLQLARSSDGVGNLRVVDHLRRQFAYDLWANQEVLNSIRTAAGGRDRSLQLMSHILAAERLWLERLEQKPQSLPVWPQLQLEGCQAEASELGRLWATYLEEAGDLFLMDKNGPGHHGPLDWQVHAGAARLRISCESAGVYTIPAIKWGFADSILCYVGRVLSVILYPRPCARETPQLPSLLLSG